MKVKRNGLRYCRACKQTAGVKKTYPNGTKPQPDPRHPDDRAFDQIVVAVACSNCGESKTSTLMPNLLGGTFSA